MARRVAREPGVLAFIWLWYCVCLGFAGILAQNWAFARFWFAWVGVVSTFHLIPVDKRVRAA